MSWSACARTGLVLMAGAVSAWGCGSGSGSGSSPLDGYRQWIEGLPAPYAVAQGNAYLMQNTDCPTYVAIFDSCFGQNPAAPYIIPQPAVGDSYVDPYYGVPLNTPGPDGTTNIVYRLTDTQALVTILSYPPKGAYFGYQSYVFTREASDYAGITPPRPRVVSPDPDRYELFGSVGNDVNNLVVEAQYGRAPWGGRVIMYVTTSNQNLADALIADARAHGIEAGSILVEPLGSNVITGSGAEADDLVTLMRYALPESPAAAADWQEALSSHVLVYTVSNPESAVTRFGANQYTPHTVNRDETPLLTALQQLTALLQTYLTSRLSTGTAVSYQSQATSANSAGGVPDGGLVGAVCIEYGNSCEGDNQDTSTYATLIDYVLLLGPEDAAAIVGVNHSAENVDNSRYVSIDIYDAETSSGIASASQTNPAAVGFDDGVLTGSASEVLAGLGIAVPAADEELMASIDDLYVAFVARDCGAPAVAAVSEFCIDLMGTSLIALDAPISITERSYVVPGTTTGGYVAEMVYPYVIAGTHNFIAP